MPFEFGAGGPRKIAVIGAGISGMGAAYQLASTNRVTLIEAEPRLGGHARTIMAGRNGDQPVDTGFLVFNYQNYPHLASLFRELDVQPATRYWCVKILQELFPSRTDQIEGAVKSSDSRFIVTESMETGLTGAIALPTSYPWNLPVVFESGTYRVHAVTRPADAQAAAMGDSIRSF